MTSNRRIEWLAIWLPAFLVGTYEIIRHRWLDKFLPGLPGTLIGSLLVAFAGYAFIRYFVEAIARTERELGRSRAEAAVLAERERIGREMHDGVAQALFLLKVRLQELREYAREGDFERVGDEAAVLADQLDEAYDQVRSAIAGLKQQASSENASEALGRAARRAAQDLSIQLHLEIRDLPQVDGPAQQHLQAIVSEAITNAARHGGATQVTVTAGPEGLTIADNGRGFDLSQGAGGFGLMIMEERAVLVGGKLTLSSEIGRGTRVRLEWQGGKP